MWDEISTSDSVKMVMVAEMLYVFYQEVENQSEQQAQCCEEDYQQAGVDEEN